MKIEVVSTYYREEFLAPLFMRHYETWTDRITLITEKFPDNKFDDQIKIDWINEAVRRSDADWLVVVDMDEFVYPMPLGRDPRQALEQEAGDVIQCRMSRVWRHVTDSDINRLECPLMQRIHGTSDHHKPCIFRPRGVRVEIGMHNITLPDGAKWGAEWAAAHWANADPCFGLTRATRDRQLRLSDRNIRSGWGVIREWLQPGFLERKYREHLHDPRIIQ